MVLGYPKGLTKKDIPYEGQIIRVADEYDAIVSKRQYKSHIGISDTIKILIENANPKEPIPASTGVKGVAENAKLGKNNPLIVKALISVVIEDIEYEISCSVDYLNSLSEVIKRLNIVKKYEDKMNKANNDKKKQYFLDGMKMYLTGNETVENYSEILNEYNTAYSNKKKDIDHLYDEIRIIKKLKV